ncbi:MAG: hypothetical protein PVG59_20230, partial [Desulfobacterales bacterium]
NTGKKYLGSTWVAIKHYNPRTIIYTHADLCQIDVRYTVCTTHNANNAFYLRTANRYDNGCGHSMGASGSLYSLWYHNKNGKLLNGHNKNFKLLNPGNSKTLKYVIEAWETDFLKKPWTADGVASDGCCSEPSTCNIGIPGMDAFAPIEFSTVDEYMDDMSKYLSRFSDFLHANKKGLAVNHGGPKARPEWQKIDSLGSVDYLMEEGVFVVWWGTGRPGSTKHNVNFLNYNEWLYDLELIQTTKKIPVMVQTHCKLKPGETGIDNFGKTVNAWDAFYYGLASFLLAKKESDLYLHRMAVGYNNIYQYFDEYDSLNFGEALGKYQIKKYGKVNIYFREFEKGYVFVNPTQWNAITISLPQFCKQRTHDNLDQSIDSLPDILTINLDAHRAALSYKSIVK